MTIDTEHCQSCGRAFSAPAVDRDPYDDDRCTDCTTRAVTRTDPEPETPDDEKL